jgi:hypothetical protein
MALGINLRIHFFDQHRAVNYPEMPPHGATEVHIFLMGEWAGMLAPKA